MRKCLASQISCQIPLRYILTTISTVSSLPRFSEQDTGNAVCSAMTDDGPDARLDANWVFSTQVLLFNHLWHKTEGHGLRRVLAG